MSSGDRTPYEVLAVRLGMALEALCGNANATHEQLLTGCAQVAALRQRVAELEAAAAPRVPWPVLRKELLSRPEVQKYLQSQPEQLHRRPEIRLNDDGTLDEIVGTGAFQIEQMDDGVWWISLGGVSFTLCSEKKIKATVQDFSDWKTARDHFKEGT